MEKKDWISIGISMVAVLIALLGFINQLNFENHYNGNAKQVMINSADLAIGDIDRLSSDISNLEGHVTDEEDLEVEQKSLEENLQTVQQIEITSLPKQQIMNYQFYRQELKRTVLAVEDGLSYAKTYSDLISKKDKKRLHIGKGIIYIDSSAVDLLQTNLKIEKDSLQSIENYIKKDKKISNDKVQKANSLIEDGQLQWEVENMLISGMGLLLAIISLMCSVWTAGYKAGAQWQRKHEDD